MLDTRHRNDLGKPREAVSATKSSAIMSWADRTAVLVPGLIAASLIAVLADYLRNLPLLSVISPMMLAMLIGMMLNNAAGLPNWASMHARSVGAPPIGPSWLLPFSPRETPATARKINSL